MSSKTEVEAKFHVRNRALVIRKLRSMGASEATPERITDFSFSMPDRDAWEAVESIRMRIVRGKPGGTFSYKPRGQKVQRTTAVKEYETHVDDPSALMDALLSMGLKRRKDIHAVSKTRRSFSLGKMTVDIDDLGKAGCFAEIEVMTRGSVREKSSAFDAIDKLAKRLGFSETDRINMSIGYILHDLVLSGEMHPRDLR